MSFNVYTLSTVVSLAFLVTILELVRSRKLKEQYSLLWILISLIMVLISGRSNVLEKISTLLGVYYPPAVLFLFGLIFAFAINLHFSLIISRYHSEHVKAVQELALLTKKVEDLEQVVNKLQREEANE